MFDSGITAKELIEAIQNEADIAPDIPEDSYIQWLNSVEQLLYSEVIKEQKKYNFGATPHFVKTKVFKIRPKMNIWPLFESQRNGDAVLDVSPDGTYRISIDNANHKISERAAFETRITLPAGTYTLSDNSEEYFGGMPASIKRISVARASDTSELAGLSMQARPNMSATFTLDAETEVVLRIIALEQYDFGEQGHTLQPQLELGSYKTEEFIPPADFTDFAMVVCGYPVFDNEADARFEDIKAVYAGETQLIRSTLASGVIFPDTYFKAEHKLGLHISKMPGDITLIYFVRPVIKTSKNISTEHVMVPVEFINLVKAKLRGEAYKLANEDELAAKWLNDYNIALETFREWVQSKSPSFGL